MKNWINWGEGIGSLLDMPLVGWQISIGHPGLPNKCVKVGSDCSYEDTFFPYFFSNVKEFIDAGFIGMLVGKGLADDTDFSNPEEGEVADRGWFLKNCKTFDKGRPYLS